MVPSADSGLEPAGCLSFGMCLLQFLPAAWGKRGAPTLRTLSFLGLVDSARSLGQGLTIAPLHVV